MRPNEVWTYDFLEGRTERGGKLRIFDCARRVYAGMSIMSVDFIAAGAPNISPEYSRYLRPAIARHGPDWHRHGLQPWSAIEAQVIAARTYIYQRIQYASQYGTPNNSNQFQVFVPYYYDTLTVLQKIMVQIATSNRHYLSESAQHHPIERCLGPLTIQSLQPERSPLPGRALIRSAHTVHGYH